MQAVRFLFFCLNASATLRYPGTLFVEKGLSGSRHDVSEGVEEFAKLNFGKIYHEGSYDEDNWDIKDYRHSEVIREDGFLVEPLLQCILCRKRYIAIFDEVLFCTYV